MDVGSNLSILGLNRMEVKVKLCFGGSNTSLLKLKEWLLRAIKSSPLAK